MPSQAKQDFVKEFTEELKGTNHVLLTDYMGLNSEAMYALRTKLRDMGANVKVVKNRLGKLALKNIGWEGLNNHLKGPSAFVYKGEDSATIVKVLYDFGKANKKIILKAGHLYGNVADKNELHTIATLPSRDVLLSTLLYRLNGPLQTLVATLNEPMRSLYAALSSVAKKKESDPAS